MAVIMQSILGIKQQLLSFLYLSAHVRK